MRLNDWQNWLIEKKLTRGYFRARLWAVILLIGLSCLVLGIYNSFKTLPAGLDYQSPPVITNLSDITWLTDTTYTDNQGATQSKQEIFETIFNYIEAAEQYILVDMFLLNDFVGREGRVQRPLSKQLIEKLIAKKQAQPDMLIDVIVDPINTVYGGYDSLQLKSMSAAGINVIVTKLNRLRDDNAIYTAGWRLLVGWWGNSTRGWLPHPFASQGAKVSLRSYLAMLNFKANHRKVFLMDHQGELVSLIGSANAHDASSPNSNAALAIKGIFGQEVYRAESAVATMSQNSLQPLPSNLLKAKSGANQYAKVSLITESQIRQAVINDIGQLNSGDQLMLAMFYLSDRPVIKALLAAAERGVEIKIILDPNKDAFGYKKNGIPNRSVAAELLRASQGKIALRWYQTTGEQFHTKMLLAINKKEGVASLILGSANFTKRNIGNYNLEADVRLTTKSDLNLPVSVADYFNRLWTNADGASYTADYEKYKDETWLSNLFYRLQEATGLSSF